VACLQAGARKVYAVEATAMANHARKFIAHNKVHQQEDATCHSVGCPCLCHSSSMFQVHTAQCALQLSNVIEVIQGTIETVELPEKVTAC
jgi:hypothetical protein